MANTSDLSDASPEKRSHNASGPAPVTERSLFEEAMMPNNALQRWTLPLEQKLGLEVRGIARVPEEIRTRKTATGDYVQMGLFWFSANLTANNAMIGLLGPLLFDVGLTDGMVLAAFGAMAGAACTAYISTFGPISGNRTLVIARYTMGWWPSRLCVLLNIVIMLGYGIIDIIISAQIMSHINGAGMTIVVGVIISAVITLGICIFGIRIFHVYERYAYIPQMAVLFIIIGCVGPHFDDTPSVGNSEVKAADKMSFFFLCMSGCLAWAPASADFYVYFPSDAKRWNIFMATTFGLGLACAFTYMMGIGIASGVHKTPGWAEAYDVSVGALFDQMFTPLGIFGHVCSCVMALGLISNAVPSLYSSTLSFQLLGHWFGQLPRPFWTLISVAICTVCACAGRNKLFQIFDNFLALIGYWTAFWVTMTLEEELLFRRRRDGYDWAAWNDKKTLPIGLAALAGFLVGWLGATLSMSQTYFTGPLGKLVGDGIDLGIPVSSSWAAIVYPPLRWLELKHVGR